MGITGWFLSYVLQHGPPVQAERATVTIPKGSNVQDIIDILAEARLIHADFRFILLTKLTGLSGKMQAGEFSLLTNRKPADVIRELARARPVEHSITIAEGLNVDEIATLLAEGGWVDRQRFMALSRDRHFLEELGLTDSPTVEGYLYPDTYRFVRPAPDEKRIITKLVDRSLGVWDSLAGQNSDTSPSSTLSRHQVFTLASIIEKETAQPRERPIIAAVFLNRLKKKMKLQSDPTVRYGVSDSNGKITRTDLKRATPYNTYVIPALPPGPICSPGRDALQAVLSPAENDYIFFVSKNDGSHYFSKSLREHNRAVRKYQRN